MLGFNWGYEIMDKQEYVGTLVDMGKLLIPNHMHQLISDGKVRFGDKFDSTDLDSRFARYYFSKERIKVRIEFDKNSEIVYGYVGKTTGWKPSFILLYNSRSISSSTLLDDKCCILGVQQKGHKKYSNPY